MFEKYYRAIAPKAFVSDGSSRGEILLVSTAGFKVKMRVQVSSDTQSQLALEVKRVYSATLLAVGPVGGSIDDRTDISAFTMADSAAIAAIFQPRPSIPLKDINRVVYEEEPTVAIRTLQVDRYGQVVGGGGGIASDVNIFDSVGAGLTSTTVGGGQGLDVYIIGDDTDDLPPLWEEGAVVAEGNQAKVAIDDTAMAVVYQYSIPAGTVLYLKKALISAAAYGAEAQLEYANGASTIVLGHYYFNGPDSFEDVFPRSLELAGGATAYLRVRAQTAGNVHKKTGEAWAFINGYRR